VITDLRGAISGISRRGREFRSAHILQRLTVGRPFPSGGLLSRRARTGTSPVLSRSAIDPGEEDRAFKLEVWARYRPRFGPSVNSRPPVSKPYGPCRSDMSRLDDCVRPGDLAIATDATGRLLSFAVISGRLLGDLRL